MESGLAVLLQVLKRDRADEELTNQTLEIVFELLIPMPGDTGSTETELGELASQLLADRDNTLASTLLSLLTPGKDSALISLALQLLSSLVRHAPELAATCLWRCTTSVNNLVAVLDLPSEGLQNEALALLAQVTSLRNDFAQMVAFQVGVCVFASACTRIAQTVPATTLKCHSQLSFHVASTFTLKPFMPPMCVV